MSRTLFPFIVFPFLICSVLLAHKYRILALDRGMEDSCQNTTDSEQKVEMDENELFAFGDYEGKFQAFIILCF